MTNLELVLNMLAGKPQQKLVKKIILKHLLIKKMKAQRRWNCWKYRKQIEEQTGKKILYKMLKF
jgi:hypothetical protein